MVIKCKVEEEDFVEPLPTPGPPSWTTMRTQVEVDHGNEVTLAGGGRWFAEGSPKYNPNKYWFHDGTLGWHLDKANLVPLCPPKVGIEPKALLTNKNWSHFTADNMVKVSINGKPSCYIEISSPFKGESK